MGYDDSTNTSIEITNAFYNGQITADADDYYGGIIGGFYYGDNYDNWQSIVQINNSFWDTEKSGTTNIAATSGSSSNYPGATGLSTSQINSSVFTDAGWSSDIWDVSGNSPVLKTTNYYSLTGATVEGLTADAVVSGYKTVQQSSLQEMLMY